jgi:uroporphyrinogen-III synthase
VKVLILRPRPGADATAAKARACGLEPVVAPLFSIRALAWKAPDAAGFDAVMLTSANAPRHAGGGLTPFQALPCYAVGGATAAAAGAAGFAILRIGPGDAADLLAMMAADGVRRVLHPCGRDHVEVTHPELSITRIPVYAADAVERLAAQAEQAIAGDAVVLLHSPRAAAVFSDLAGPLRSRARIIAISAAAADAAGAGWKAMEVATVPRDEALLEVAAKLCQNASA